MRITFRDAACALYRFFDVRGELLYVGITWNPERRFAEHAADKDWFEFVDHYEIEWFDFRSVAEDAEAGAIWWERPRFNIANPVASENRIPYRVGGFRRLSEALAEIKAGTA